MKKLFLICATICSIALTLEAVSNITMGVDEYQRLNKAFETVTAQRDRLSDYIRILEDHQELDSTLNIREVINNLETEDNAAEDIPPMRIDDWGYAY